MVRIQAKQETSLKWLPVQANTLPPNQVVKCVMKLNPATGKMEGKVLNVDRAVACPDGKHAQIFFKAEIKLNGVSTIWETGYLFIEHWPDLVAMFAQKPSTVSNAAVWDAKTLSWKGWLQAYSKAIKGGEPAAALNTQKSSTPSPSIGPADPIGGMMKRDEAMAIAIPKGCSRITPNQVTPLKAKPIPSGDLSADEKDSFDMDEAIIGVVSSAPGNHVLVTLPGTEKIKGRSTWFLFKDHIKIETPGGTSLSTPGAKVTEADYDRVAKMIGCETRTLKAVVMVEAAGGGFLPSGRPKILLEAHWFSDLSGHKYNESHPEISSRKWNPDLYKGGEQEWERFEQAAKINRKFAIGSCSWGLPQIMGAYSWEMPGLGFKDEEDFYDRMCRSEADHLEAMGRFIMLDPRLVSAIKSKNFAKFALAYNGESYLVNAYDQKLQDAYDSLA